MTQLRFYQYAALGLLVFNLAIIAFFFVTRPTHHDTPGKKFRSEVPKMLHLDEAQQDAFLASAMAHNKKMAAINSQQKQLLEPYFQQLVDTTIATPDETALESVQVLEQEKVVVTYQHFAEVKAILRGDQMVYFEAFMEKALRIILLRSKKKGERG